MYQTQPLRLAASWYYNVHDKAPCCSNPSTGQCSMLSFTNAYNHKEGTCIDDWANGLAARVTEAVDGDGLSPFGGM